MSDPFRIALYSPSVWTPSRWLQAQFQPSLTRETRTILAALAAMRSEIMATLEQFKAALSAVDAETTRIGDYIATLLAQLNRTDLTEAQEAEVLAGLQAAADRLKTVGTSVEQPVPTTPLPAPPVV